MRFLLQMFDTVPLIQIIYLVSPKSALMPLKNVSETFLLPEI